MRKAGRQQDEQWALEVFDRAPYVTVSIVRPDGTPYGLPLSLVRKDSRTFYFHCAHEGEKIEALRLLCQRFLPPHMSHFDEAIARSLPRTAIYRITLTEPPIGKCKE